MRYAEAMDRSTRFTSKYRNYAALYDVVVATLPASPTVVEIGIANGGSLQTWRTLLGPDARIVGIDLNERSVAMRDEGFEVVVMDTGQALSWRELAEVVPEGIDLLVDDGGHTNRQQLSAILYGIDLIRDGGWLVIEDLHASFMREFGNPSPYSTARLLEQLTSDLHRAHPRSSVPPRRPHLASSVEYVVTGTSWSALRIRRWTADAVAEVTAGSNATLMDYDHRWDATVGRRASRALPPWLRRVARGAYLRAAGMAEARSLFNRDTR